MPQQHHIWTVMENLLVKWVSGQNLLRWWLDDQWPNSTKPLSEPMMTYCHLGWGLLSEFSPFRYFPHFPLLSKQTLAIEYHVYIWQVSPQLSCGDTCQIWMWFRESKRCFCKIENFAYGEISERSFSNPHPRTLGNKFSKILIKIQNWSVTKMWLKMKKKMVSILFRPQCVNFSGLIILMA